MESYDYRNDPGFRSGSVWVRRIFDLLEDTHSCGTGCFVPVGWNWKPPTEQNWYDRTQRGMRDWQSFPEPDSDFTYGPEYPTGFLPVLAQPATS